MHNALEVKGLDADVKMIVPSIFLKDFYQAKLPQANIAIVPNGIDLEAYQASYEEKSKVDLGLSANDTVIFYAGRIVPDKGILQLLQAFEKISESHENLKLVVVGDHLEVSKSDKGAYQREVRNISERLNGKCLLLGSMSPEKMNNYYAVGDLVVIPSQVQEAFCMVAIEAMGAGKPVLVSTRGGMTEFVKHKQTGFHLREPMTVDSIAEDIVNTLKDKQLTNIAMNGKKFVYEHYSWLGVTQVFEDVIRQWFD